MGTITKGATIKEVPQSPDDEDIFRSPPGAPTGGIGARSGQPASPEQKSYVEDQFGLTAVTHTMGGHQEHPDLPGISAGSAHRSAVVLGTPQDQTKGEAVTQSPRTVEVISCRTGGPQASGLSESNQADALGLPVGDFDGPQPTQLEVDPTIVSSYSEKLKSGEPVPPIEVVLLPDGREFITEGHHRYVASQNTGIPIGRRVFEVNGPVGFSWNRVIYSKLDNN